MSVWMCPFWVPCSRMWYMFTITGQHNFLITHFCMLNVEESTHNGERNSRLVLPQVNVRVILGHNKQKE